MSEETTETQRERPRPAGRVINSWERDSERARGHRQPEEPAEPEKPAKARKKK